MWEVVVRREVRPMIDDLRDKRAGYGQVERELERYPVGSGCVLGIARASAVGGGFVGFR
jgi:hypothetical protein